VCEVIFLWLTEWRVVYARAITLRIGHGAVLCEFSWNGVELRVEDFCLFLLTICG